eukprot:gene36745-60013_t
MLAALASHTTTGLMNVYWTYWSKFRTKSKWHRKRWLMCSTLSFALARTNWCRRFW